MSQPEFVPRHLPFIDSSAQGVVALPRFILFFFFFPWLFGPKILMGSYWVHFLRF